MQQITFQAVRQTTQSPAISLGAKATTVDGRRWVYGRASEAILRGKVAIPAATTSVGTVISSSANGDGRIVYITKAAAGWTPGAFQGGYVLIDGGTGSGQVAKIIDNTNDTLVLAVEDSLATALATDSTMKIVTPWYTRNSVITSKIQNAIGIAQTNFAANDYGWFLVQGYGVVLAGSVLTVGAGFTTGDGTTPGQVIPSVTAQGAFDAQALGVVLAANSGANLGALVKVALGD